MGWMHPKNWEASGAKALETCEALRKEPQMFGKFNGLRWRHPNVRTRTAKLSFVVLAAAPVLASTAVIGVVSAQPANAWSDSSSVSLSCPKDSNTVVLSGTFSNEEKESSSDMNVTMVWDQQSAGPKLVAHLATGKFTIDTGLTHVDGGQVEFNKTWVNRSGKETSVVPFGAKDCRPAPIKVTAGTPTFTEGSAVCTEDYVLKYTKPTFTVPAQRAHIEFRLNGSDTAIQPGTYTADFDQTVSLTAVADKGYVPENGPIWTHTFKGKPEIECERPTPTPTPTVTPTPTPTPTTPTPTPTVTPSVTVPTFSHTEGFIVCTQTLRRQTIKPTFTLSDTKGVLWLVDGNPVAPGGPREARFGSSMHVVAISDDGSGTVIKDFGMFTFGERPEAPDCGRHHTSPPTNLPVFHTGADGFVPLAPAGGTNWWIVAFLAFAGLCGGYILLGASAFAHGFIRGGKK